MRRTIVALALIAGASAFSFAPITTPSVGRRTHTSSSSLKMVVSKKDSYKITSLPGDGIGPEIMEATKKVCMKLAEKQGFKMEFTDALIGGAALDACDDPFPDATYKQMLASDSVLLAAIGGPKWDKNERSKRPESGLLKMRKSLGLFANLRPAVVLPQLIDASTLKPEVVSGVDIMVVRELTGDVYFGEPKGIDVVDGERFGYNNMCYKESEVRRIAKIAFDIALKRKGKVCSVDKANVLDVSQLWRDVVIETHQEPAYNKIELEHMYVDNAAMQLIRNPKQFDVMVTGNIFGDILSDEASMLVGSLGMLPSASVGDPSGPGVFEPCHGSAPDIAGKDLANPLATILSAAMMLRFDLDRPEAADAIEAAVSKVLDDKIRTGDIMEPGMTQVGCKQMGEEVVKRL
eukprot:CAMPEP_0173114394 /NCGR_PEP_ID=MMETSP1102-20130122/47626_1 /TAXON_ID=49646 /ORGANISM="Geminigera sp., Strain Caron Lab Isolate" /LENGTH=404 /DNA_ID=CAMNT_0014016725 /DNA_START=779 /DNA_END=1993 /DNA_ORIENTATION=+